MSEEKDQQVDETADFVSESEDVIEVAAESQEVDVKEVQASTETTNTEDEGKEVKTEAEVKADEDTNNDKSKEENPGESTTAEPKKHRSAQKRIDKVVKEREQVKREKEALERELAELKEGKKSDKQVADKEPVEDDFETYDEYLDAVENFDNAKPEKEAESKKEDKQDNSDDGEVKLTDSQKTAYAVLNEAIDSDEAKPDDFNEVALADDVMITPEMLEALAECDNPVKVMYQLGQDKEATSGIAKSSPVQQMRAIAKLDMTVGSKKIPDKPTKTTNAADPINPVAGSDAQEKANHEKSFSEYEADRNKTERKRSSTW